MRVVYCFLLLITLANGAYGQTQWNHNGSIVTLHADGASRQFRYDTPREGLPVVPGTVLFSGRRVGNTYSGSAYVFSPRCGPRSYPVSGTVAEDQRSVLMEGNAPTVDTSCKVVGFRKDTLLFSLIEPNATASTAPSGQSTLENPCPPPGNWVRTGAGLMCQCSNGTYLSVGQTCPTDDHTDRDAARKVEQFREQMRELFLADWRRCNALAWTESQFNDALSACNSALRYHELQTQDRTVLISRRTSLTSELSALRQRQRDTEQRQKQYHEEFRRAAERCASVLDVEACNTAYNSPVVNEREKLSLNERAIAAQQFHTSLAACKSGSALACDQAGATSGLSPFDRGEIERLRVRTSFGEKLKATLASIFVTTSPPKSNESSPMLSWSWLGRLAHVHGLLTYASFSAAALMGLGLLVSLHTTPSGINRGRLIKSALVLAPAIAGGVFTYMQIGETTEVAKLYTSLGLSAFSISIFILFCIACKRHTRDDRSYLLTYIIDASFLTALIFFLSWYYIDKGDTLIGFGLIFAYLLIALFFGLLLLRSIDQMSPQAAAMQAAASATASRPSHVTVTTKPNLAPAFAEKKTDPSPKQSSFSTRSSGDTMNSLLALVANGPTYVVLYLICMVPTYILPYFGSNSSVVNMAGQVAGLGFSPAFWVHFGALLMLCALAWVRGAYIAKQWIVTFPVIALAFDLVTGLNFVPFVPTVMHLLAIILGISSPKAEKILT